MTWRSSQTKTILLIGTQATASGTVTGHTAVSETGKQYLPDPKC